MNQILNGGKSVVQQTISLRENGTLHLIMLINLYAIFITELILFTKYANTIFGNYIGSLNDYLFKLLVLTTVTIIVWYVRERSDWNLPIVVFLPLFLYYFQIDLSYVQYNTLRLYIIFAMFPIFLMVSKRDESIPYSFRGVSIFQVINITLFLFLSLLFFINFSIISSYDPYLLLEFTLGGNRLGGLYSICYGISLIIAIICYSADFITSKKSLLVN